MFQQFQKHKGALCVCCKHIYFQVFKTYNAYTFPHPTNVRTHVYSDATYCSTISDFINVSYVFAHIYTFMF
jgi:hypothetical protein